MKSDLILGDCLEVMKDIPDNSVDSIVTDPPYHLVSIVKRFGKEGSAPAKEGTDGSFKKLSGGFMGKTWDGLGEDGIGIANNPLMWAECLRVLKPGGYLLSFGGTRTYHRMASAIEDAGFEVRDMIEWVYGCLSEDTEILTKDGWKYYNKITGNNPVFCYNVDKDIFEYHLPTNYFLYENKHTAYRIQSDTTDQIVSRNHRVAVEQDGRIIFKYAETLKQQENIPVLESMPEMGETFGNEYKRTSYKEQILLGLCVKSHIREKEMKTEGIKLYVGDDMSGMLKAIYDEEEETLKVLLSEMQLNSEMKGVNEALTQVKILMDGKIKAIIQSKDVMTELQVLEELRNTYEKEMKICKSDDKICEVSNGIYGDGEKGLICDGTQTESSNGNTETIDKDGVCTSYKPQCGGQQDGEPNVIQDKLRTQELGEMKKYKTTLATVTETEYNGIVWCVEVHTGCFVARRNGKIFITGNSGFPKSLNIGKAVDKLQGNKRKVIGENPNYRPISGKEGYLGQSNFRQTDGMSVSTKGTSEWEGWGTALKPAHEPICMARKPLAEKTVAENCLKWGTGGINIDESRVEATKEDMGDWDRFKGYQNSNTIRKNMVDDKTEDFKERVDNGVNNLGRFPANLIHDNSEEVRECFPETKSGNLLPGHKRGDGTGNSLMGGGGIVEGTYGGDSGNASRFFKSILYYPKSSKADRSSNGAVKNIHPTCKPTTLMEYLIKMVTPKGGIVLDPFAGSGSTLIAAKQNGFKYIGIELTEEYIPIIKARLSSIRQQTLL